LGKRLERKTKDITIDGDSVRIQKPTPLDYSDYISSMAGPDGKLEMSKFSPAILKLTARMWVDGDGKRLFQDNELAELAKLDLEFYETLSIECQQFASPKREASKALGESVVTTVSGLPAGSVLNSE